MSIVLLGSTSGSITLSEPAVAGTNTLSLPAVTGTLVVAGQNSAITAGTAVASTSGTSIDFTSIPSWVRRITIMFNQVSTGGTSNYLVQVGSGSFTISGYTGQANSGAGISQNSTGWIVCNNIGSGSNHIGAVTILLFGSNTYIQTGLVGSATNSASMSTSEGAVTLGGVLDRVRITSVTPDTFDNGSINILYE